MDETGEKVEAAARRRGRRAGSDAAASPGSAALLGWGLLTSWGLVSLSLEVPAVTGGTAFVSAFTSLASVLGCIAVLVACLRWRGVGSDDGPVRPLNNVPVWSAAAIMCACSIADQVVQRLDVHPAAAISLQLVASLAYIVLMYLWFAVYSARDPQDVERGAILSTALCAAVCLLGRLLPSPATAILWAALPLASAACLGACGRTPLTPLAVPAGSLSVATDARGYARLALLTFTVALPGGLAEKLGDPDAAWQRDPSAPGDAPAGIDDLIARRTSRIAVAQALSQRERQVLELLLRGYSTAAIRNELVIAKGTVDTHIYRIYQKCGVHSRQGLVEFAETIDPNE